MDVLDPTATYVGLMVVLGGFLWAIQKLTDAWHWRRLERRFGLKKPSGR